jgi:hypothetical protein
LNFKLILNSIFIIFILEAPYLLTESGSNKKQKETICNIIYQIYIN